jgi:hypothetical protein
VVHNVLEAARKALDVPEDAPAHSSGPLPVLYNTTYMELALWIADRVRPKLSTQVRAVHDEIVAVARPVRTYEQLSKTDSQRLYKCLALSGPNGAWDLDSSSPTAVADGVAFDAIQCDEHATCGKGSRAAAAAAARLLGASFLDELDAELVRLDAVTMLQKQEIDPGAPIKALWRGTTGTKTTHWIVELSDGRYGLIAKARGRWTWFSGSRDDVMALVPEAQMKSAFLAVAGEKSAPASGPAIVGEVVTLDGAITGLTVDAAGTVWLSRANGEHWSWPRGAKSPTLTAGRAPAMPPSPTLIVDGKKVTVRSPDGTVVATCKLDQTGADRVVFAGEHILIGYHQQKRVAVFDRSGRQLHRVTIQDIGRFDWVYPLERGAVLAYSTFPHGESMLVDYQARPLAKWRFANKIYKNGSWHFAQHGPHVAYAHSIDGKTHLLRAA